MVFHYYSSESERYRIQTMLVPLTTLTDMYHCANVKVWLSIEVNEQNQSSIESQTFTLAQ